MTLIQELVNRKIINKAAATVLEFEAKNNAKREEDIILEKKLTSEDFLFGLKSEMLKVPLKTISVDDINLKALEVIPEASAKYYKMAPIFRKDNFLEIGMVYPDDIKAREALEFLARQNSFTYQIFLVTPSNLEGILRKYRTLKKEVTKALEELKTEMGVDEKLVNEAKAAAAERVVEDAPISKMVAVVLRHAVDGSASDIHIEPMKDKVRVRFRMDGELHSSLFLPLNLLASIVARIKILCNMKIDETRVPQDGRFSTIIEGRNVDFRVSTFPTSAGEKVAIRILDVSKRDLGLEALGIFGRNLRLIKQAMQKSYGMILATGPTGSGKTTTLYSILTMLNTEDVNVMTLEDPIEYYIEGLNQSQVRPEIDYTFSNGLRSIVRQDPDIIMVGEIRDEETASLAIHAALTGHIVLSTLHTSNTAGVAPRFIDMGVDAFLLPPTISIAIAQRLLRKLCPYCKKKIEIKPEVKKIIETELAKMSPAAKKETEIPPVEFVYEPVGCKRCGQIGYSGRIGIYEILEMTDELGQIIMKDHSEYIIEKEAIKQGMITMKQDGMIKVLNGVTSLEEVLRAAEEK